jgi:RNA polymerase sigma-B factor
VNSQEVSNLFTLMHTLPHGHMTRTKLRTSLVTEHLPLARQLARRHCSPIERLEDLEQVAVVGLIKAVDAYDPRRQVPFPGYAVPKILGEVWRHLRDSPGTIRVPRPVQELQGRLRSAQEELTSSDARAPSDESLALCLGVKRSRVTEALQADDMRFPLSLDQPIGAGTQPLHEVIGSSDSALETVEQRQSLISMMADLTDQQRRIVLLRVLYDMSQRQIGEIVGVSQMHVSRLLSEALRRLRQRALADM